MQQKKVEGKKWQQQTGSNDNAKEPSAVVAANSTKCPIFSHNQLGLAIESSPAFGISVAPRQMPCAMINISVRQRPCNANAQSFN